MRMQSLLDACNCQIRGSQAVMNPGTRYPNFRISRGGGGGLGFQGRGTLGFKEMKGLRGGRGEF